MLTFPKNIIQLIISPDNGWEDVSHDMSTPLAFRGMSWMIVITALTAFVGLLYNPNALFIGALQRAVAILVTFWITYVIADFILSQWLGRLAGSNDIAERQKLLITYTISLLSLQPLLANILPLSFAILELWPLYVVVIMWRAMTFLDVSNDAAGKYLIMVILAFIVPSQLLIRLFYSVILQ